MKVHTEDENAFVFHVNDPVDFELTVSAADAVNTPPTNVSCGIYNAAPEHTAIAAAITAMCFVFIF